VPTIDESTMEHGRERFGRDTLRAKARFGVQHRQ
jgi:hypothetical protein